MPNQLSTEPASWQEAFTAVNARIGALEEEIGTLKEEIDTLKEEIDTLKEENDTLKEENRELRDALQHCGQPSRLVVVREMTNYLRTKVRI
jgi:regulator of replication initiation timing